MKPNDRTPEQWYIPDVPEIYYKHLRVDWSSELIYIPFSPKTPLKSFHEGGKIFMSKQVPLLISINLATEYETEAALKAINSRVAHISPNFSREVRDISLDHEQDFSQKSPSGTGKLIQFPPSSAKHYEEQKENKDRE